MVMHCHWCGGWSGVQMVRRNGQPVASPEPGVPLHLCWQCWGLYRESGRRADQRGRPRPGPISGQPITPEMMRQLGRR